MAYPQISFCSTEILIVCDVADEEHYATRSDLFYTILIKYRLTNGCSIEGKCLQEELDMISRIEAQNISRARGIGSKEAEKYFIDHSKLNVISPSTFKSRYFGKQQEFERKQCIQLYCSAKGIIPIGEYHFPSSINCITTDVLEGYGELLGADIYIGSKVVTAYGSGGTLGGFVRYLGKDSFLTCAHVVPGRDCLLSAEKRSSMHENQ